MGYITLGVLIFTALALFFGMIFGAMRGSNRAILRLVLVILCVVASIAMRGMVTDIVMDIETGEGTVKELLMESFNEGDSALPESIQALIFSLIEILIGLVAFFVLFIVLRIVSWMIIFPICKIFVKRGARKRAGLGAIVGLLQGAVCAFVICAPVTGIITQVEKIAHVELEGEQLFEIPEEVGTEQYLDSTPGKIYTSIGGWFFNTLTTTTDANGNKISINDTCDIVVTVVGVADTVTSLSDSMDKMASEEATPQDRIDAMKDIGNKLKNIDGSIDGLSTDAKTIVNEVLSSVKDMVADEGGEVPPEVEEAFNNLNVDNLKLDSAGAAMSGIATYIEKTHDEFENDEPVTQEEVNDIVNGFADNTFILDILAEEGDGGSLMEVAEEDKAKFETAFESSSLSEENKDALRNILGMNENNQDGGNNGGNQDGGNQDGGNQDGGEA